MSDMIIYSSEKECGISDLMLSTSSTHPILGINSVDLKIQEDTLLKIAKAFEYQDNIDLYPVFDITVSTGLNKNDEYFDKNEILKALGSSINKPFNIGHNPVRIIGHIFGEKIIDNDCNILDSNGELPDQCHILTGSVIYTQKSRGAELEVEMANMIAQIQAGEWFVSVETLFPRFDYFLTNDSETKIIERNAQTAFLSKYLRVYGGEGVYKNYRIGRKLLDIVFSGKGLVYRPANPNSIILNSNSINGENIMAEEVKRDFEGEIATLQKEVEKLNADLTVSNEKHTETNKALEVSQNEVKRLTEELTVSANTLKETLTALDTEKNKNTELALQMKRANRISALINGGVEKSQAEELVNKTINSEDGVFDILVASQTALVAATKKSETKVEIETIEEEVATAAEKEIEKVTSEEISYSSEEVAVDNEVLESIAKFIE
jgi:hypothetical protein